MPKLRTVILAGAATVLFAGAAVAATANLHTMSVALPDGSVAHIQYVGDVAPKVSVNAADARDAAYDAAYADPFAAMDAQFAELQRVSAMMEAQHAQMMRQMAAAQAHAASAAQQGGQPGQLVVTGNMPAGSSYQYTMVSTSNGKGSCTQTVEWRSDGASKQPQVTRASSGDCGAVKGGEGDKVVPVSTTQKAAPVDPRSI